MADVISIPITPYASGCDADDKPYVHSGTRVSSDDRGHVQWVDITRCRDIVNFSDEECSIDIHAASLDKMIEALIALRDMKQD